MTNDLPDALIEKVGDTIERALMSHRLAYTREDDEELNGLFLVDALTPPDDSTILKAKEEITLIVDTILDAVSKALDISGILSDLRFYGAMDRHPEEVVIETVVRQDQGQRAKTRLEKLLQEQKP